MRDVFINDKLYHFMTKFTRLLRKQEMSVTCYYLLSNA